MAIFLYCESYCKTSKKKCLSRLENWLYLLSSPTLLSIMRSVFLGLWTNPQSNREGRMWRLSNRNLLRCVQLRAVPSACLLRAPGSKGLRRRHYNVGCYMWRLSVRVRIVRLSGLWVHWGLRFFFCSSETRKPFYVYSKSGPLISFLLKISKHPFVQMLHTLPLTTESETMSVTNATGFNHDLFLLLNNPFFSS